MTLRIQTFKKSKPPYSEILKYHLKQCSLENVLTETHTFHMYVCLYLPVFKDTVMKESEHDVCYIL